MATNNKPDLSDLKARLGLKKPAAEAAPAPEPQPAPQAASSAPAPTGHQQAPQAPQAPQAHGSPAQPPRAAAPPVAARPPQAAARPKPRPRPQVQPVVEEKLPGDHEVVELPDDIKLPGSRVLSLPVIALVFATLVLGLLFGYFATTSSHHRSVANARTADAQKIRDAFAPKVETLRKANPMIEGMSLTDVDFELATTLSGMDLAVSATSLSSNRLLLGPELTDSLTNYIADSQILAQLISEHHRITTVVDRDEIEQMAQDNEVLERDLIAVVFDYRELFRKAGEPENYMPRPGRLVTLANLDRDEEGRLEFQLLNSERKDKTELFGIIPIGRDQILKSAGDNALQRYERRVGRIKVQAHKMSQYHTRMMERLNELADQEPAPLLKLTS